MRTKAERRHNNWHKAIRKRRLYKDCFKNYTEEEKYDNLHQYSKNKIHVSDAHGGKKTNNRGRKKYYGQGCKLWKASDLRKIMRLKDEYTLSYI